MSEIFTCDDKDMLVAYLYDEIDAIGRREVDRHLRTCAACAQEVDALRSVRHDLSSWQPPDADLSFTVGQKPATVLQGRRWWPVGSMPAWAQAVAAILVLATGAAIANVHVRYGNDGLTVSTGWMTPALAPVPAQVAERDETRRFDASVPGVLSSSTPPGLAVAASTASEENWRLALTELEQRLRDEMTQMKRTAANDQRQVVASGDAAALVKRVDSMLEASEQRQRQELATRFAQFNRDIEMRRSADMVRINHDFGQRLVQSVNLMRSASVRAIQ